MPLIVPDTETGEDRPEGSGDPSRSLLCSSSKPVAFALDDPTAGAAFWLSVLPMCNLCSTVGNDVLADARDSVGL